MSCRDLFLALGKDLQTDCTDGTSVRLSSLPRSRSLEDLTVMFVPHAQPTPHVLARHRPRQRSSQSSDVSEVEGKRQTARCLAIDARPCCPGNGDLLTF